MCKCVRVCMCVVAHVSECVYMCVQKKKFKARHKRKRLSKETECTVKRDLL
jgi:hypothetical protein